MPADSPEDFHAWFLFWSVLLYGALSLFAVVAVIVTVQGGREIRVMLSRLKTSGESKESAEADSAGDGFR